MRDRTAVSMLLLCWLIVLWSALIGTPTFAQDSAASQQVDGDATPARPQRVIIEVGRNETAYGTVELESDELIVIRNRQNQPQSYAKTRILRIVRLVDPEPEQTGVVMMRDGSVRSGVILEDTFEHVLIEVEGIRARLVRETVSHVVLKPTFEQTYQQFKRGLLPNRPESHLELCKWLYQLRKYELCRKELEELLANAELGEARRLMRMVDAQLALQKPDTAAPSGPAPIPPPSLSGASEHADDADMPREILTHDDVNLIRVYEIDFEHPPKVRVEAGTIQKLIDTYSTNKLIPASRTERNALFNAEPLDIVEHLIFELRARELYPEIKVETEPYALNLFRLRVHNTWLMNNCASTDCHGGTDGGRLFLYRDGYRDQRVRYTNYLILERLKLDPDKPPLIDYENPMQSLLIQHGLPREEARFPHPDVLNWTPAFPAGNSKLVEATVGWIEAMMQPRPEYPIDFTPPDPRRLAETGGGAGAGSDDRSADPGPRPAFPDEDEPREGRKPR